MRNRPGPFPTGFQAALLYLALLLSEVVVSSALRDAQGLLNLSQMQRDALSVLLGNGLVFVLVMHFRGLTYRGLFHDSRSSARATFFLVVPPVLMLIPALLLVMGVVHQGLQWAFPLSAWEQQYFDPSVRPRDGVVGRGLCPRSRSRGDALSRRHPARVP